eukprot:m.12307 g.12307  ORF g.12307 m.12307 type:complete len:769 (-) comp4218_c0_seq1:51-2357(-)
MASADAAAAAAPDVDMTFDEYKLSATLIGHSGDARAVCSVGDLVATASRDQTARVWQSVQSNEFACKTVLRGHSRYLMSITYIPPTAQHPQGLVATGSLDQMINLYEPAIEAPIGQLTGHSNAVCGLAVDPQSGNLLSASWDGTARAWSLESRSCLAVMTSDAEGNASSQTCVACHPLDGTIVTGGADHNLRIWHGYKCEKKIGGHSDVVRGLAVVDANMFLSAANDATIKLWTFEGVCMQTYHGHSNYVYGICTLPGEGVNFASCGELDGVKVWRGGELQQTIALPCTSVWAISARPNGDLLVGCDDASVRVFTRSTERVASDGTLAQFDEMVQAALAARSKDTVGGIDKSKLQDRSALATPGTREGENKLVNNAGVVESYTWSAGTGQWQYQGQVVEAPTEEYETFTIQLDDSGQSLQLRHKIGDNPYETAKTFIQQNGLDVAFLEQIAEFIEKNSKHIAPAATTGYNPDPLTGTGARPAQPTVSHFPNTAFVAFESAKTAGILKKLREFNTSAPQEAAVSDDDWDVFQALLEVVLARGPLDAGSVAKLLEVTEKLLRWDLAHVFPALDVVRILLLHPDVTKAAFGAARSDALFTRDALVGHMCKLAGFSDPSAPKANKMLALRGLCNAFKVDDGALMIASAKSVLQAFGQADFSSSASNVILAAATLLLNFATAFSKMTSEDNAESEFETLSSVYRMLLLQSPDAEAVYRLLVALGTMVGPSGSSVLREAAMGMPELGGVVKAQRTHPTPKVAACAQSLCTALKF